MIWTGPKRTKPHKIIKSILREKKGTCLAQDGLETIVPHLSCKLLNLHTHPTELPTGKLQYSMHIKVLKSKTLSLLTCTWHMPRWPPKRWGPTSRGWQDWQGGTASTVRRPGINQYIFQNSQENATDLWENVENRPHDENGDWCVGRLENVLRVVVSLERMSSEYFEDNLRPADCTNKGLHLKITECLLHLLYKLIPIKESVKLWWISWILVQWLNFSPIENATMNSISEMYLYFTLNSSPPSFFRLSNSVSAA